MNYKLIFTAEKGVAEVLIGGMGENYRTDYDVSREVPINSSVKRRRKNANYLSRQEYHVKKE